MISRVILRLRAALSELAYAQRRAFELTTGIPVTATTGGPDERHPQIDELEALFALPAREPGLATGAGTDDTARPRRTPRPGE